MGLQFFFIAASADGARKISGVGSHGAALLLGLMLYHYTVPRPNVQCLPGQDFTSRRVSSAQASARNSASHSTDARKKLP